MDGRWVRLAVLELHKRRGASGCGDANCVPFVFMPHARIYGGA